MAKVEEKNSKLKKKGSTSKPKKNSKPVRKTTTSKVKTNKKSETTTKKVTSKRTNAPKQKVNKSIPKVKEEKITEEENWYSSVKKDIIEHEKKYTKENKYRNLFVYAFAVFCFLVVLVSTIIIDFSSGLRNNTVPYFTIKTRDEYKQVTIYKGLFYKVWQCDNGNTELSYGRLGSNINYCEIIPTYKQGYFTNPNKIKMTESQVSVIKKYYFDNYIYFKTKKEVTDAYELSKKLNNVWWIKKEQTEIINNDESVELAIFGKTVLKDGVETFEIQYNDLSYYKCAKKVNNVNIFSKYYPATNSCGTTWETVTLDESACSIASDSTDFIQKLVEIAGYCE